MYKKTIKYVDYNGLNREEDFYFNLNKAEIAEMNMRASGNLVETYQKIVNAKDYNALVDIFKDLIRKSYGVKSEDGKHFIKNEQVFLDFAQTEAYSELFVELASDAEAAAEFFNGIIPSANTTKAAAIPATTTN